LGPSISVRFLFLRRGFLLLVLGCFTQASGVCHGKGGRELRIMWYNVENLFHPDDDSLAGDDEFTPAGSRNWSLYRYRQKLTALAKVIVAAGYWEPPGVVGMCEVENRRVLEDLISHPVLAPYHYRVVHSDSPDHRGMDVACLYREDRIGEAGWRAITCNVPGRGEATRQILLLDLVWRRDTLELILLHFISKFGGEGATADPRRDQAVQLAGIVDSLYRVHPGRLILVAGDFNEIYEGYSMEPVRTIRFAKDSLVRVALEGWAGSYKYQGKWSCIDQFLACVPHQMYRITGMILNLPVLLVPDETYGGSKPFRTYQGPMYAGGISDHLPVLVEITRSPFSAGSGW
jgi:hypothetical protein